MARIFFHHESIPLIHWLRILEIFIHFGTFSKNTYYNDLFVENDTSVENSISGNLKLVSTKIILGLPVQMMSVDTAVL